MAKKTKVDTTEDVQQEELELNYSAFTTYKDPVNGHWVLAEIKFDPVSGQQGELEILFSELDRSLVQERFRVCVAEKLF